MARAGGNTTRPGTNNRVLNLAARVHFYELVNRLFMEVTTKDK